MNIYIAKFLLIPLVRNYTLNTYLLTVQMYSPYFINLKIHKFVRQGYDSPDFLWLKTSSSLCKAQWCGNIFIFIGRFFIIVFLIHSKYWWITKIINCMLVSSEYQHNLCFVVRMMWRAIIILDNFSLPIYIRREELPVSRIILLKAIKIKLQRIK